MAQRLGVDWRYYRLADRSPRRVWSVVDSLSADRARKTVQLWTVPAFFPIMFELTVLFAAFSAFFAWQIMNGLPRWHHPMFNWDRFSRVTNDGFFLAIEARDPRFSEKETHDLLDETGGSTSRSCTRIEMLRGFLLIFVLVQDRHRGDLRFSRQNIAPRRWEIFPDMVRQQKVRAQSPIDFFSDGRGPRLPIASTVPIGYEMPMPD